LVKYIKICDIKNCKNNELNCNIYNIDLETEKVLKENGYSQLFSSIERFDHICSRCISFINADFKHNKGILIIDEESIKINNFAEKIKD
jgi:hypothetical protein